MAPHPFERRLQKLPPGTQHNIDSERRPSATDLMMRAAQWPCAKAPHGKPQPQHTLTYDAVWLAWDVLEIDDDSVAGRARFSRLLRQIIRSVATNGSRSSAPTQARHILGARHPPPRKFHNMRGSRVRTASRQTRAPVPARHGPTTLNTMSAQRVRPHTYRRRTAGASGRGWQYGD